MSEAETLLYQVRINKEVTRKLIDLNRNKQVKQSLRLQTVGDSAASLRLTKCLKTSLKAIKTV